MELNQFTALYYLCQIAGLAMIVGGIWLIYKEKIYIDSVTKEPIEISIPLFGKLKTNLPALALFALGFIPVIYPIWASQNNVEYYKVKGHIKADPTLQPIVVYSVIGTDVLRQTEQDFTVRVPVLKTGDYHPLLLYVAGAVVSSDQLEPDKAQHMWIDVGKREIQDPAIAIRFGPAPQGGGGQ